MLAYGKKAKMREARAAALKEIDTCVEHFDLVLLKTLHDEAKFGAKRLKRFFRAFVKEYEYYKQRYLTSDDTTVCGDRADTYALKKHLKDIGFDYDAECDAIRKEEEQKKECDSV